MSVERDRRSFVSLGNVLTILGLAGAVIASYGTLSAENARQKERVDNLKEETREIKKDVKETKDAVQLILRKLDSMEAERMIRDRNRDRRGYNDR